MENEKTWGGARKGAGRKLMGDAPRVTVACSVAAATKAALYDAARERGVSVGRLMDRLVESGRLHEL